MLLLLFSMEHLYDTLKFYVRWLVFVLLVFEIILLC